MSLLRLRGSRRRDVELDFMLPSCSIRAKAALICTSVCRGVLAKSLKASCLEPPSLRKFATPAADCVYTWDYAYARTSADVLASLTGNCLRP